MAETPTCAYQAAKKAAAQVVITIIYRFAQDAAVLRYLKEGGEPPFAPLERTQIMEICGFSSSHLHEQVGQLEKAGCIIPAEMKISGQLLKGWRLPLRVDGDGLLVHRQQCDAKDSARADSGGEGSNGAAGEVRSGGLWGHPPNEVTPPGRVSGPPGRVSDEYPNPTNQSSSPAGRNEPIPSRALALSEQEQYGVNNEQTNQFRPAWFNLSVNSRGKTARERGLRFVTTISGLYIPPDPDRRITPSNPEHVDLAARLLTMAVSPDDNVFGMEELIAEWFATCLALAVDFAEICRTDWNDQARHWRPWMLSKEIGRSAKMSPWRALEKNVLAWRRERREQEASLAAQAKLAAQAEAAAIAARLEALEASQGAWDNRFVRELQDKVKGWTPPMALRDAGQVARALAAARRVVDDAVKAGRAPRLAEVERAINSVYETAQLPAAATAPPAATALQAAAKDSQAESVQEMAKRLAGARQAGSRMRDDVAATQRAEQMQAQINQELLAERNRLKRVLTPTEAEDIRIMVRERWKQ